MLPIGVVIPTRNAMPYLPAHVAALNAWADLAQEIVVVDSHSTDGTPEYLRTHVRHPRLCCLSHPPGLYQSWNHGIAQLRAPFTYMATVGDTTTRDGLLHLFGVAEKLECDACLSVPRFIDPLGRPVPDIRWPIHQIIEELDIRQPRRLTRAEVVFYAVTSGGNAVLGSSASNLYRTDVLQRHPFPDDFEMAGDTVWGLRNSWRASFGITPQTCANFLFHPKDHEPDTAALGRRIVAVARQVLREASEACEEINRHPAFEMLRSLLTERELYKWHQRRLESLRRSKVPWVFNWRAWHARSCRNRHKKRVRSLQSRCAHSALLPLWEEPSLVTPVKM